MSTNSRKFIEIYKSLKYVEIKTISTTSETAK